VAWRTFVGGLYDKEWVVYSKEPFGGPEQMLKYLTGHTHRVALSNHRLVRLEDDRVTFAWKDYADGCRRKEMPLDAVGFVQRFELHIVPRGLVRIRRYGLLAHRDRTQRLALCRSLLAAGAEPTTVPENGPVLSRATEELGDRAAAQDDASLGSAPVGSKPASLSRLGIGVLAALIALGGSSGAAASSASAAVEPPAPVVIDDRCPQRGLGHMQTIWQAVRPRREERQRLPILDSS
jgi:hypothetical protein